MKSAPKKIKSLLFSFSLVLLWTVSGLIIGKLTTIIFSPKTDYANVSEELNERFESNSLLKIFSFDEVGNLSEKDIEIIGLVAGSNNGAILISIKKGAVRTLKAGEVSEDGWIFKGISTGTAVFFYKGQTFNVPFSGNKNNILENKLKEIKKTNEMDNHI